MWLCKGPIFWSVFFGKGFEGQIIFVREKSDGKEIENLIRQSAERFKIPQSNVAYDHDGVGGFLGGYLKNAYSFVNGSKALKDENYQNLRSQCYFKLAEKVNNSEIFLEVENEEWKRKIIEELDSIKEKDADKDGKLKIIGKDEIKLMLGRSPDFADTIMMRMVFQLNRVPLPSLSFV